MDPILKASADEAMAKPPESGDVNVRLPRSLVDQAAKLSERLPKVIPQFDGVKLSTAAVLRMAITRGLQALEEEMREAKR